jgi:hypothetical protein
MNRRSTAVPTLPSPAQVLERAGRDAMAGME